MVFCGAFVSFGGLLRCILVGRWSFDYLVTMRWSFDYIFVTNRHAFRDALRVASRRFAFGGEKRWITKLQ